MMTRHQILGLIVMASAAMMTYALIKSPSAQKNTPATAATLPQKPTPTAAPVATIDHTPEPLAVDIETENKIIQQRQKERDDRTSAQEAEVKRLWAEQERASQAAASQAAAEIETANNLRVKKIEESQALTDSTQSAPSAPKASTQTQNTTKTQTTTKASTAQSESKKQSESKQSEAKKPTQNTNTQAKKQPNPKTEESPQKQPTNPKTHTVTAGDTWIRLSRKYDIPVSVLAAANDMGRNDTLRRGATLKIPSQSEIKALQNKVAEQKKRQDLDQKLNTARRQAKQQGINDQYAVQVLLASDKNKAQAVVAAYKKAGYNAKAITDSKGVRVVVGPERSQEAANLLKQKINADSSVESRGAWVLKMPQQ